MALSVFYSWQSDSAPKTNRYFIRDCLEKAARSIGSDDQVFDSIRIDYDTKDVPGTPDIFNSILEKIDASDVFVADLSISARTSESRLSPNPNVLIELGYAIRAIGGRRIICIMNESLGSPENLPFDLAHKKWPIRYTLASSDLSDQAHCKLVAKQLTGELKLALRSVLIHGRAAPRLGTPGDAPSFQYIRHLISESDPREDWEYIPSHDRYLYVNKHDVNLRMTVVLEEYGRHLEEFREPWANRHPDPRATSFWCDIYYGATHAFRSILVTVDGGRAWLPLPRQSGISGERTEVLPLDYKLAQVFDSLGTLDEYMRRSRLTVAPE